MENAARKPAKAIASGADAQEKVLAVLLKLRDVENAARKPAKSIASGADA